ncbi:MAG: penicillin-binding protein activator [Sulfuricella denitrificans]|nr:penicillin-binding protein activator [Sulfuricella denitrificans]
MQYFLSILLMFLSATLAACAGTPERPARATAGPVIKAVPKTVVKPPPQTEVTLSPLLTHAPPVASNENPPALQNNAVQPAVPGNAHVALLLPLKSPAFGAAADVVRQGFMAGASVQSGALPVIVYPSSSESEDIVATYRQATQAGASIVVGPLTRSGVSALAASVQVNVPTLALNQPEQNMAFPAQLYVFGLAADLEARQMAHVAYDEGNRRAAVIASDNMLSKRIQQAFSEEWAILGGTFRQLIFNGNNSTDVRDELARLDPEAVFLAMDSRDARILKPFLDQELPTYATSQIYAGSSSLQKYHDLNGVQFIDMPWLLQPDHIAVMVYPRPQIPLAADMERLYALGIDAWRLALQLRSTAPGVPFSLDGVTGRLTLDVRTHQIGREGARAEFSNGEALLLAQ